jgi:hypothetical protein
VFEEYKRKFENTDIAYVRVDVVFHSCRRPGGPQQRPAADPGAARAGTEIPSN